MVFITAQSVLRTSVAICVLATAVARVTCSKKLKNKVLDI